MILSIFNSSPLIHDLIRERQQWRKYLVKLAVFGCLVFALDFGMDRLFLLGLDRYFGLDRSGAVLCVGHSRTVLGIDAALLEQKLGMPVVKYALDGANLQDRLAMIRHYFNRQPNSVRLVIYDVDAYTFSPGGLSANSYQLFFPFLDNPEIHEYLKPYDTAGPEHWLRRIFKSRRYDETTIALAFRGMMGNRKNLKRGTVDIERLKRQIARGENRGIAIDPDSLKVFQETLQFIRSRGAKVLLAYIPVVDVLNDVDRKNKIEAIDIFKRNCAADSGILYLDYNRDYEHRHELFYDGVHMNPAGQKVITRRLGADVALIFRSGDKRMANLR